MLGKCKRGPDRLRHGERAICVHHECAVWTKHLPDGVCTIDVGRQLRLAHLDLHRIESRIDESLGLADELVEREVQVDASTIGPAAVPRTAGHLPKRLSGRLAADVPKRDVNGGYGERRDASPGHVVNMQLHGIVERLDIGGIPTGQKRRQVVLDHRHDGMPAPAARVGISSPFLAVACPDGDRNELEFRVVAVLGVRQHFRERNGEAPDGYV